MFDKFIQLFDLKDKAENSQTVSTKNISTISDEEVVAKMNRSALEEDLSGARKTLLHDIEETISLFQVSLLNDDEETSYKEMLDIQKLTIKHADSRSLLADLRRGLDNTICEIQMSLLQAMINNLQKEKDSLSPENLLEGIISNQKNINEHIQKLQKIQNLRTTIPYSCGFISEQIKQYSYLKGEHYADTPLVQLSEELKATIEVPKSRNKKLKHKPPVADINTKSLSLETFLELHSKDISSEKIQEIQRHGISPGEINSFQEYNLSEKVLNELNSQNAVEILTKEHDEISAKIEQMRGWQQKSYGEIEEQLKEDLLIQEQLKIITNSKKILEINFATFDKNKKLFDVQTSTNREILLSSKDERLKSWNEKDKECFNQIDKACKEIDKAIDKIERKKVDLETKMQLENQHQVLQKEYHQMKTDLNNILQHKQDPADENQLVLILNDNPEISKLINYYHRYINEWQQIDEAYEATITLLEDNSSKKYETETVLLQEQITKLDDHLQKFAKYKEVITTTTDLIKTQISEAHKEKNTFIEVKIAEIMAKRTEVVKLTENPYYKKCLQECVNNLSKNNVTPEMFCTLSKKEIKEKTKDIIKDLDNSVKVAIIERNKVLHEAWHDKYKEVETKLKDIKSLIEKDKLPISLESLENSFRQIQSPRHNESIILVENFNKLNDVNNGIISINQRLAVISIEKNKRNHSEETQVIREVIRELRTLYMQKNSKKLEKAEFLNNTANELEDNLKYYLNLEDDKNKLLSKCLDSIQNNCTPDNLEKISLKYKIGSKINSLIEQFLGWLDKKLSINTQEEKIEKQNTPSPMFFTGKTAQTTQEMRQELLKLKESSNERDKEQTPISAGNFGG